MNSHPNKVVVLVETLFIPEELKNYREVFEANGFEFELAARLWNQPKLTFYSDNVSDTAMEGPKPLETIEVTTDVDEVNRNLSQYAAVLVAANYTSVRARYFLAEDGSPRNVPAVRLIARAMRDPKIVKGALCHGLWLLTPIPEYIAGRKVRCHEVVQADIVNAGANVQSSPNVIVDGDLVTGHSKAEARALAEAVVAQIQKVRNGENLRPDAQSEVPRFELPSKIARRRILIGLSEWGYWGEELIGPLEVFQKAGYELDFFTPTGKRPNAIPVSKDPDYIDPPLGRSVTTAAIAARTQQFDDPSTPEGALLEHPINLAERLPERPYAAAPGYVRALENYNRDLDRALETFAHYDALLIVGGSGPIVDMANNGRVHELILGFVRAGKVVAAECYGVTCLAFARNWEDRKSIVWGKRITGHCLEYDYHDGTGFVKARDTFLDFNMGPPPYPLEFILRDATGPEGAYIGNFGKERSVIVDYPFVTGRSTPDSYLTGQKVVEVLETGLRRWGW